MTDVWVIFSVRSLAFPDSCDCLRLPASSPAAVGDPKLCTSEATLACDKAQPQTMQSGTLPPPLSPPPPVPLFPSLSVHA